MRLPLIPIFALLSLSHVASAQHATHAHGSVEAAPPGLSEGGQGAFAALAEVIARLDADPGTDWTEVNIATLAAHLQDMDRVFTGATVAATDTAEGATYAVTGEGVVADAIVRMAEAHAATLPPDWQAEVRRIAGGAEVAFAVPEADRARLRALGFLGLLAYGAHHRAHHWAMATGADPH